MQAAATEARSFGKYTLVAKLATGGMAEIFLARLQFDGGFEKLVCIKRILPHLARDPQFVAMFLDEARVAARISHPNVCQVFELGEIGNQYYIAMEYLEGVPLSLFRRPDYYPGLPDPRLVAGFGVQACEGLHHAHQLKRTDGELLGVVHPDVSPLRGDVIARALSRNRDDRVPSARALGEALAQAVGPLGGTASSAQISAEVENAFAATLAEQHTLLRIAREGGQFDLEGESPLVGHGTQISTTPVSNIQRRVAQAKAEVAHFVAAQQAIDSLVDDQSKPFTRPGSDGAFTPAPTRRSNIMGAQAAPQSGPT